MSWVRSAGRLTPASPTPLTPPAQLFTELPLEQIEELSKLEGADVNKAKVILADEATKMLHGEECLAQIHATVANLFTGAGSSSTAGALMGAWWWPTCDGIN